MLGEGWDGDWRGRVSWGWQPGSLGEAMSLRAADALMDPEGPIGAVVRVLDA